MNPLVPIEVDEETGVWTTDGLPMLYVPRHFFVNNHREIEAALGRERYSDTLFRAGHRSAHFWCEREARTHTLEGLEVFEHYLRRLSQRGWGQFRFTAFDARAETAEIRLDNSLFALAEPEVPGRNCYMFSGWFAGAMDWVTESRGGEPRSTCRETQCRAEGHSHCTFCVAPATSNSAH